MARVDDVKRFYEIIASLGTPVPLGGIGKLSLPKRGVYFFFEDGEMRSTSGNGPRVIRVGTHALKTGSQSKLKGRLSQHRGKLKDGGGNHRGSIFRLLLGTAIGKRQPTLARRTWGEGNSAAKQVMEDEHPMELEVSRCVRAMRIVWLDIPDNPGPSSQRGYIERHSIGLLSNWNRSENEAVDPPSQDWLGSDCAREKVRRSGLWNQDWVDFTHEPSFLDVLDSLAAAGRVPA